MSNPNPLFRKVLQVNPNLSKGGEIQLHPAESPLSKRKVGK
jgi:hypothetical protein